MPTSAIATANASAVNASADIPALDSLDFIPYINDAGQLPDECEGSIGVYAVFDRDRALHYVGYSRDMATSLKLHLVRQPESCFWVKAHAIARPSRTLLENIRAAWMDSNGDIPIGNALDPSPWETPIDVKEQMTQEERDRYADKTLSERDRIKALKQAARRIEAEILAQLEARHVAIPLRFNPKLKEEGWLDLKA
ncbi:MAG: GIY-YIG nuclease family protein [Cyanobacteria bacterium J06639_1]